ncbi:MAG: cytidine deaminase [Patescibacteria group bacterium]
MLHLTPSEQKLLNHAKKQVVKYNKIRHARSGIDTLYAFVVSDSGKIHDGGCLEVDSISHASVCGERHAIANMVLAESYQAKVKTVVVADPVPKVQKDSSTPCGTCRALLWEFGTPQTTVICLQYIQKPNGWIFPKWQKFILKDLYPHAYQPVKWE